MSEPAFYLPEQIYSESIIQSARNGDQEALRELYDTTKNYAWFIAKRYLQNDSDVEDVLQEVYINAFSKLDTFKEGMPFKPWLHRIVSNKCIDSIRKNKHIFISPDEIGELTAENEDAIPAEWLERTEKRRDIIKIIDALPHSQRMAVTLFYLENYPISKIAQDMGVTLGTVKYNLHHGRNRIKEAVMLEEKKGNKLYSLVPIPPLLTLYASEAEAAVMSELAAEAVWAGTASSLAAGGILAATSSVAAPAGLVAKFAALSTGMKAATVAAVVAVAGTAIVAPVYLINTNTPPAYIEEYQINAGEQEESALMIEGDNNVPGGTDAGESEQQELAEAQSSTDALDQPVADSAAQDIPATDTPVTEPSAADAPAAKPLVAEAPVTVAPDTLPLVAEPPDTEQPGTEPPVIEQPVIEQPVTEPAIIEQPVTEAPIIGTPVTEAPVTEAPVTEPPVIEPPVTEPPVTEPPVVEPPAASGNRYTITNYYNEDGGFSALGLALEEKGSEKVLTVKGGDILMVGSRQYTVTANSLTLSFYTQPSLANVTRWWTDYLNSWAEGGAVIEK